MDIDSSRRLLGYDVTAYDPDALARNVLGWIEGGGGCRWLACINPHSFVVALREPRFREALGDADWLVPDGAGIIVASRILGAPLPARVTGSDVFHRVCAGLNARGRGRIFLLGATNATLDAMARRVKADFPAIEVAGAYSPSFSPQFSDAEVTAMVEAVNSAQADVLWVGMTAPKQELWISQVRSRLNVKFAAAVGAVFDYYSGRVKRPGRALQRLGLEWLPRLLQEPRRLWRRTLVSAPVFLWHVLLERIWRRHR